MSKNHLQLIENQPAPVQNVGMITPAASLDEAIEQFNLYQQLKKKLGSPEDFQRIGDKQHPKKSFVRKVQRFFNVSCAIIQDEPLKDQDGNIIAWLAKARAIHRATGAYQEADGSCGFDEKVDKYGNPDKKRQTIHNIRSHAVTRAKNRAILDLVGFGEVSAEEINEQEYDNGYHESPQQNKQNTNKPASQKQIAKLMLEAEKRGLSEKWVKAWINYFYKKDSRSKLTVSEASEMIEKFMKAKNEELEEILTAIKAHYQAQQTQNAKPDVIDVDPETGEVVDKDSFKGRQLTSDEEINKALGLTDEGEDNQNSFADVYDSFEAQLRKGFAE